MPPSTALITIALSVLPKVSLTSTSQPGMVKELLRTLTDVPVFFSVTEMPDRV